MPHWSGSLLPGLPPGNPLGVSVENCDPLRGFGILSDLRYLSPVLFFFSFHSVVHLVKENCSYMTVALSLRKEGKEGNTSLE